MTETPERSYSRRSDPELLPSAFQSEGICSMSTWVAWRRQEDSTWDPKSTLIPSPTGLYKAALWIVPLSLLVANAVLTIQVLDYIVSPAPISMKKATFCSNYSFLVVFQGTRFNQITVQDVLTISVVFIMSLASLAELLGPLSSS